MSIFDTSKNCPHTREKCMGHDCALYRAFSFRDPQTGENALEFACVYLWTPYMSMIAAQQAAQGAAATEDFRNQVVGSKPVEPEQEKLEGPNGHGK